MQDEEAAAVDGCMDGLLLDRDVVPKLQDRAPAGEAQREPSLASARVSGCPFPRSNPAASFHITIESEDKCRCRTIPGANSCRPRRDSLGYILSLSPCVPS